jgi:hypothetical protein
MIGINYYYFLEMLKRRLKKKNIFLVKIMMVGFGSKTMS